MQLKVLAILVASLSLVDHKTQLPIDCTFENETLESSDPTVFTTDITDGILDVTGVSVGEGTLTVTADVTYIDGNTGESVTANKSATIEVVVTAPAPEAELTDLVVTLSAPAPAAPAAPVADTPAAS